VIAPELPPAWSEEPIATFPDGPVVEDPERMPIDAPEKGPPVAPADKESPRPQARQETSRSAPLTKLVVIRVLSQLSPDHRQ